MESSRAVDEFYTYAPNIRDASGVIAIAIDSNFVNGHGRLVQAIIQQQFNGQVIGLSAGSDENEDRISDRYVVATLSQVIEYVKEYPRVRFVVNMSWGSYVPNPTIHEYIEALSRANVVFVAAAGNDNCPTCMYPADDLNVICVGSVNRNLEKTTYSNYGPCIDKNVVDDSEEAALELVASALFDYEERQSLEYRLKEILRQMGTSFTSARLSGQLANMLAKDKSLTPLRLRMNFVGIGKLAHLQP